MRPKRPGWGFVSSEISLSVCFRIEFESQVCNRKTLCQELLFVEGLDREDFIVCCTTAAVDVVIGFQEAVLSGFDDFQGGFVEELAVRFQVDGSGLAVVVADVQEVFVAGQEDLAGEAFAGFVHLGIGEGDPDFGNFVLGKEGFDEFDADAQEGDVREVVFGCILGTFPQTGSFDVHADVVLFRMAFCQSDGVFAFSATQFEDNGVVIAKHFSAPVAFQRVIFLENIFGSRLY